MSGFSANDTAHMALALRLAVKGRYTAHPNPMVGCVIVKDGARVGEGWHEQNGAAHAEINALNNAGDRAKDATVFVTLEPCAHHGKTPPCASALIAAGVQKVVVAVEDPFPKVAGRGIAELTAAGIDVTVGLLAERATDLNRDFFRRVTTNRPLVRLKLACSLDGAIAMTNGESQWITGPHARADVQRLRAASGAILTGIGTVLSDDPSLTVRAEGRETNGRQPLRVVLDTALRMPLSANMLALPGQTLLCHASSDDGKALEKAGAELLAVGCNKNRVNADDVLSELARRGINSILVEAGPTVAGYFLEHDLVDELVIYQAPHIMGSQTQGLVRTPTWSSLSDRLALRLCDVRRIGRDTRIIATPERDK